MSKQAETVSIPADIAGKTFVRGEKDYNPRAAHNSHQWEKMTSLLDKAGDKGVSGKDLAASLVAHFANPEESHFNFVSYLLRRNALAIKS